MATSAELRSLLLQNYRCLPDAEIGPFARFNMIYGRNGSGKTSLLEAIQLCLTGWTFRSKSESETKSVVARHTDEPLVLALFDPSDEIARYDDAGCRPGRAEMLKTLYDIDASGPKARFLLDQMFRTHNILYSEQIVAFLGAGSPEKLCEVLRELMLGRDVVEIWDRICVAEQAIENIQAKLEQDRSGLATGIFDKTEELRRIGLQDSARIEASAMELSSLMPSGIIYEISEPQSLGLNHDSLMLLRRALVRIEEAIEHCKAVRGLVEIKGPVAKWRDLESRLGEAKLLQAQAIHRSKEIESRKKQLLDEIKSVQETLGIMEPQHEKLFERVSELNRCREALQHVSKWLPELHAHATETALEASIRDLEKMLSKLEQAREMLGQLPSETEIQRLQEAALTLSRNRKKLEEQIAAREHERNDAARQLREIEAKTSAAASDRQHLIDLSVRLHESVKEFARIRHDKACPTCGTEWPSHEELYSALERQFQQLASELTPSDEQDLESSEALARLRHQIVALEELQSSDRQAILQLVEESDSVEAKLRRLKVVMSELRNILIQIGLQAPEPEDDTPKVQVLRSNSSSVVATIGEVQNSVAEDQAKIDLLWVGLNRAGWKDEDDALESDLDFLRESLRGDLGFPKAFESAEWNEIHVELRQKRDTLSSEHLELGNEIDRLRSKKAALERDLEEKERSLLEAKALERSAEGDVTQWAEGTEHVRVLQDLGLVQPSDAISMTALADRLSDSHTKVKALSTEIHEQLTAQKELSRLTDEIEEKKRGLAGIEQELKAATEARQTFTHLTSPESYEKEIWGEYSDNISRLFKKLHWPPDFVEVSLRPEGDASGLRVRLRDEPREWKLASDRLSSGQRAALAIAVFWALNGKPENVPPLILMDEPIQSVDDLNVLNFLDSLRWLVEIGQRQVFLTTANRRIAGLVRRKFSYLGEEFKEIRLTREIGLSQIDVLGHDGNSIDKGIRDSVTQ